MPILTVERLLSQLGFGSRKEARGLVRMGLVEIAGVVLEDPFQELPVIPDSIRVNGEDITTQMKLYVMLHKPLGIECSHNPQHHDSVFSLVPAHWQGMEIRSVGRLDVDSSGLLLLSNQGDFIHRVESPKKGTLKRYEATLARPFEKEQKAELTSGVMLKNEKRPVVARELKVLGERQVEIAIGEGLYHQVRRMFAAVGNHVETLHRISIGEVVLDPKLAPGEWRPLTEAEIASLS